MGRQAEEPGPTWGSWGLAAAILGSCFLLIQAQEISIRVEPPELFEGQNATLIPGGTHTYLQCVWYRRRTAEPYRIFTYAASNIPTKQKNGPFFTGRETGGPDCSMHITGLMLNDTEDYIVVKTTAHGAEIGRIFIEVSVPPFTSDVIATGITIRTVVGAVLIGHLF